MHRDKVIEEARRWLGTPYVHQASCRGAGCDCLGFIRGVWNALNDDPAEVPPPYRPDWAEAGGQETLLEAAHRLLIEVPQASAQPGDIMIFRMSEDSPAKHCAIISGENRMIHSYDNHGVVESHIGSWWQSRCVGTFKYPWIED